ncbi:MAG: hypothetical protein H0X66_02785 [Verrucomicrobia bacterium]|nr:hypothetical protein [Verrucomicrobiota bacterium]
MFGRILLLCLVSTFSAYAHQANWLSLTNMPKGRVVGWGDMHSQIETTIPLDLADIVKVIPLSFNGKNYFLNSSGIVCDNAGYPILSNIIDFAEGIALQSDGKLLQWTGHYTNATLNLELDDVIAVAGLPYKMALRTNGTVVHLTSPPSYSGVNYPTITNAVAIASGTSALALLDNGHVVSWAANFPLIVPTGLNDVVAIAAGGSHALALKNDGSVVGFGNNTYGQVSPPHTLSNVVAVAAGAYHSLALKDNGTVVSWGKVVYSSSVTTVYEMPAPPHGLTNVVAIDCGYAQNYAIFIGPFITSEPTNVVSEFGSSVLFRVEANTAGSIQYQWQLNGTDIPFATSAELLLSNVQSTDAGIYTVVITGDGASVRASAKLAFGDLPSILESPRDDYIFAGTDLALTISATNAVPIRYQWQFEGIDLPEATNATLNLDNAQDADSGIYTVKLVTDWERETNVTVNVAVLSSKPMGLPIL